MLHTEKSDFVELCVAAGQFCSKCTEKRLTLSPGSQLMTHICPWPCCPKPGRPMHAISRAFKLPENPCQQAFYHLHWTLYNWFFLLMHKPNGFPFWILFLGIAHRIAPTPSQQFPTPARDYSICFSQFQIKLLESASCIFISSLFIIDALSLSTEQRLDVQRSFWE